MIGTFANGLRRLSGFGRLSLFSAVCMLLPTSAWALPTAAAMPDSHIAAPSPMGYVSFCIRFADQCDVNSKEAPIVTLTTASWEKIQGADDAVNDTMRPITDQQHYGVAEYWNIPTDGLGDCEDYAVTKRQHLIAAGLPAAALRIAIVQLADGERHAVLTVTTDHGDFVLDNLTRRIRSWDDTDYHWIERQDPRDGYAWVSLEGPVGSVVSAVGATN